MLVKELISLAKNGELKQLSVKDDFSTVLGYINLGILELHKRFDLKTEEAIITLTQGKTKYSLSCNSDYVNLESDSELLKVLHCYDEFGNEISINDENDPLGIMLPEYDCVEVPNVNEGEVLSIIYKSSPRFLENPTDKVPIAPQLIEALLHYIGYRGHGSVTGDVKFENNTHYIRFDKSCRNVRIFELDEFDDLSSTKFEDRGFV